MLIGYTAAEEVGMPKAARGSPGNKLLDVAIELFAANGYDAVSTTQVAKAAGPDSIDRALSFWVGRNSCGNRMQEAMENGERMQLGSVGQSGR